MAYLRDLSRRKLRTTLTMLGIAIGIWALVVFGSMANKIGALVEGGSDYYAGKLIVTDGSGALGGFATAPMPLHLAGELRDLDGVDVVVPSIMMLFDDGASGMSMGTPPMITGHIAGADQGRETFHTEAAQGRLLEPLDETTDTTVLGSDLARKYDKQVGDTIMLKGEPFEVVGILSPTLTAPDLAASISLTAAQRLYYQTLPPVVQDQLDARDLVTSMTVYPEPGLDPEVLADRIEAAYPSLSTMTGKDFDQQIGAATSILNAVLVGIALISLAVGGLSVINTMAMSVAERTREIGIKRAIGGSRSRIVREFVTESALLGFLGGTAGLICGAAFVLLVNELGRSSGTILFELTVQTALLAIVFATVLGGLAGLAPAVHAARLDPVAALRYE
jgi:putative ABC transport system permease protein